MDIREYRVSETELARASDLVRQFPMGKIALDVGARDGYYSKILATRFDNVVAIDLDAPEIDVPNVEWHVGDVTDLAFADASFDFVLCAEVLEHLHTALLGKACTELARVTRVELLIGVPYKQDIRIGRTTCSVCNGKNPPWGHLNRFDEEILLQLFDSMEPLEVTLVGEGAAGTNVFSTWLMDLAGNPFGTYDQLEPCVHCGARLEEPPKRIFRQKVLTRIASILNRFQAVFQKREANWIHIRFQPRPKNEH